MRLNDDSQWSQRPLPFRRQCTAASATVQQQSAAPSVPASDIADSQQPDGQEPAFRANLDLKFVRQAVHHVEAL